VEKLPPPSSADASNNSLSIYLFNALERLSIEMTLKKKITFFGKRKQKC
jgi:hypothetical protein